MPNARRRPKVIIRRCDAYDVEAIRALAREAMDVLGVRPAGRTLLKPNCVASGNLFPYAHTRAEFIEGVLLALKDRDGGMSELAVGERSGVGIPTRHAFEGAGYYPVFERAGVKHYHFDEVTQVEIPYRHAGRLRDYVFTPEPVAKADFFVNCPKFKSHPWTTVTFSMKNYIGIQDDRHRFIDHDDRLDEKVADLQYIVQPQFIAIDAITAGESRMLTPRPFELGLVIFGDNQVAFDAVCCHIIGVDPKDVAHIRLAAERGFGPLSLDDIEILGDVTLDAARERARGFDVGRRRVEPYFEGTHISTYAGPPPDEELTDYCWGGCPGALQEAHALLLQYDQETDVKLPRTHFVFGAYQGEIPAKDGELVIFVGDCAKHRGSIAGVDVDVKSLYVPRGERDPHKAEHVDLFTKMLRTRKALSDAKGATHARLTGCPVTIAELVLALVTLADTKNPYLDPTEVLRVNKAVVAHKAAVVAHRAIGRPYQRAGVVERGAAAPRLPAHPVESGEGG